MIYFVLINIVSLMLSIELILYWMQNIPLMCDIFPRGNISCSLTNDQTVHPFLHKIELYVLCVLNYAHNLIMCEQCVIYFMQDPVYTTQHAVH